MRTGFYASFELAPGEAPRERYEKLLRQVAVADDLGFDGVLVEEAHEDPVRPASSPQTVLSAIAAATVSIRLGPAAKILPIDHPIRVAEDFAVIDIQSNGRLLFCVTPTAPPAVFRSRGIDPGEGWARFEEALDLIRHAWTNDSLSFGGRFYRFPMYASAEPESPFRAVAASEPYRVPWKRAGHRVDGFPVLPRPVQSPHPPIWIQGEDEATAAFAGAHGFTFLPPPLISTGRARILLDAHRRALALAGRDVRDVEVPLIRDVFVAEADTMRERARKAFESVYARAHADGWLAACEGRTVTSDELEWNRLSRERVIIGGVDDVAAALRRLQTSLGVRWVFCHMSVPGLSPEEIGESMKLFEGEVWSRLQG